MARTLDQINADLAQLKILCDDMLQMTRALQNFANNDYVQTVETIHKAWQGAAADQFVKKSTVVRDEILNTTGKLIATINTIATEAANYLQAEANAIKIAQS